MASCAPMKTSARGVLHLAFKIVQTLRAASTAVVSLDLSEMALFVKTLMSVTIVLVLTLRYVQTPQGHIIVKVVPVKPGRG